MQLQHLKGTSSISSCSAMSTMLSTMSTCHKQCAVLLLHGKNYLILLIPILVLRHPCLFDFSRLSRVLEL